MLLLKVVYLNSLVIPYSIIIVIVKKLFYATLVFYVMFFIKRTLS